MHQVDPSAKFSQKAKIASPDHFSKVNVRILMAIGNTIHFWGFEKEENNNESNSADRKT
jgi:hypothetical protein